MIKVTQLTLRRSKKTICENLGFEVKQGEFWGILGSNGRGKTTLLHALCAVQPAQGEITYNGSEISKLPRKNIAQIMGLLLQEEKPQLSLSVAEVVLSGGFVHDKNKVDKQRFNDIITRLKLSDYLNHDFLNLSFGEQRRVSIARLLYQKPKVYLLDEPTNHLDPGYQYLVLSTFKNLCQADNASIIMSGHCLSLMRLFCTHFLLLLENGEVLKGGAEEMLTSPLLNQVYGENLVSMLATE